MTTQIITNFLKKHSVLSTKNLVSIYLLLSIVNLFVWFNEAIVNDRQMDDSFWIIGGVFVVPAAIACVLLLRDHRSGFWFASFCLLPQMFSFTIPETSYSTVSTAPVSVAVSLGLDFLAFDVQNTYNHFYLSNINFERHSWSHDISEQKAFWMSINLLPIALTALLYREWYNTLLKRPQNKTSAEVGEI